MTQLSDAVLEVGPDAEALAQRAADWLVGVMAGCGDRITVALSGGATPRRLYELLAEPPRRDRMPWERIHWFWGDERFVPPDHPDSNYRMVREAMLSRVAIPDGNIHPVPTVGRDPEEAARAYERELQAVHGSDRLDPARPLFDLTLLGLGSDGHTASLFPGTTALEERRRWVVAVVGAKPEPRISLTFPALDSSANLAFLVAGEGKRAALARVLAGDRTLPAARLRPVGRSWFFLDRAAAAPDHQS
jgi:6-phosphogluconolactonase